MGGYRVQARSAEAAQALIGAAKALVGAGCFAIVLEGVPDAVAAAVTEAIEIPTIGIGAGPDCDGQVMVFHDLLGLGAGPPPRFARTYAQLGDLATAAVAEYAADVRSGRFPSVGESYQASDALREALGIDPERPGSS
jgi:3-methyl-2-oxobutanoate hydroxymethyltransferase